MHQQTERHHSRHLNRDMEYKVFGHDGRPCLIFPCQNGRYFDYENFKMTDELAPWIDSGKLRLFCVDGIDQETWSSALLHPRQSIEMQEKYFHYICDEFVPLIHRHCGSDAPLIVSGNSMGGGHAAILYFRRPDLFDSVIALSGSFNASFFFHDYMDELVYDNSPCHFLRNMPLDHPYIDLYERGRIHICIGQGRWEDDLLPSNHELDAILREKELPARVDFWGQDVDHDWVWWRKMIVYFMAKVIPL